MEDIINQEWQYLYSYNPKIKAFCVCKGTEVIWQTSNWDLVSEAPALVRAPREGATKVVVNGVTYNRVESNAERYVASATGNQGHFIMALIELDNWLLAWATSDAIPELAGIDLAYAAVQLIGKI
ncbi:MAG: hypothetical protein BAJATHORv1_20065 [Candidatus Thorarchaeota archaeon]|nr:MAG: hypothetical protein BAJATHORv1_20065 [Candidatus Thorarchaeota archaeon]